MYFDVLGVWGVGSCGGRLLGHGGVVGGSGKFVVFESVRVSDEPSLGLAAGGGLLA